ncbi:MAG: hypothetical protein IJ759_02270 [Bacteroidales bacterium]|nr:hypothetical protein [Bacteroidales bacterium]
MPSVPFGIFLHNRNVELYLTYTTPEGPGNYLYSEYITAAHAKSIRPAIMLLNSVMLL